MVLKEKDSSATRLKRLQAAVATAPTDYQRREAQHELAMFRSGNHGEKDAAYLIDFDLRGSQNWTVIHDLRIDRNGRVAQIDHLAINRFLEVYVIETKNLKTKVRYENGGHGWERLERKTWQGFPCPVEQNRRHIEVLSELIREERLAPERLGFSLLEFKSIVAVNPSCSIIGKFRRRHTGVADGSVGSRTSGQSQRVTSREIGGGGNNRGVRAQTHTLPQARANCAEIRRPEARN